MADRTVQINSFKYGLDTRREALASLPGTLQTAQNCHINSGGEIEKRKAFVKLANFFADDTFGLQDTDQGLVTFGSDAAPNQTLPPGVTYQRLQSPYGNAVNMSSVLFSCCFLGKAFVLAKFSNVSTVYAFYNGTLVGQITDGIVQDTGLLTPETISQLSTDLATIVNRTAGPNDLGSLGWLAHANVTAALASSAGLNETALAGATLVMSPPGVHFTPTITNNNSAAGLLGAKLIDQNYSGIAAVAAVAAFQLGGSGGTVTVTAPAKADGTGTAAVSGGAVAYNTSVGQTVADIVTAINNNTFLTGYSASGSVNTVTVYAPVTFGNFTFNLHVVTTSMTVVAGTAGQQFALTVTPANINPQNQTPPLPATAASVIGGYLAASVSGKSAGGTVTYAWQECNSDGTTAGLVSSGITINPKTGASVAVGWHVTAKGQSFTGYVLCTATDNGVPSATASRVISVHCLGPS
jgi:hypothetical protein